MSITDRYSPATIDAAWERLAADDPAIAGLMESMLGTCPKLDEQTHKVLVLEAEGYLGFPGRADPPPETKPAINPFWCRARRRIAEAFDWQNG